MGTISLRKTNTLSIPQSGRINLSVDLNNILCLKDENGLETKIGLGELIGSNYIFVRGSGTDTENAEELLEAYNKAKSLLPSPSTAEDAITILVAPGLYNFGSSVFEMDTEYINLVSLSPNPYTFNNKSLVKFNSTDPGGTISINTENVLIKGVDVGQKEFIIASGLSTIHIEDCIGGDFSFGGVPFGDPPIDVSGTFVNCLGGNLSFGGNGEANGTFINCIAGDEGFGYDFASGNFINCVGGDFSFAFGGIMNGYFENCRSGIGSFGSLGIIGFSESKNCTSGEGSFGYFSDIIDSVFENCTAGEDSFGASFNITNEGKFYRCRLISGYFDIPTLGGFVVLGIDGDNTVQNITGV